MENESDNNSILESKEVRKGIIRLVTGLHVGGTKESFSIGGSDAPVAISYHKYDFGVRKVPIIPGSSLKGKMRSLLELSIPGVEINKGQGVKIGDNKINYLSEDAKLIPLLFGVGANENGDFGSEVKISRLVFRDCFPTGNTVKIWDDDDNLVNGVELKSENTINRFSSTANPRFIDRVPAGSEFEFEIILQIFKGDPKEKMLSLLNKGIKLIEQNYLGGNGTRGYGKIEFVE